MKLQHWTYLIIALLCGGLMTQAARAAETTVFDFNFQALQSEDALPLGAYRGKVLLVVNTASHCGFTSQYEGLEAIYKKYQDKGLVIIGVPSDAFNQEFGSDKEIADFCRINYGVSFPMTSLTAVKGDDAHPLFKWLDSDTNGNVSPRWNFHKFLFSRDGKLIDTYSSLTGPNDKTLIAAIEQALADKITP